MESDNKAPQTPWQKYIVPNKDYLLSVFKDSQFEASFLAYYKEVGDNTVEMLVNNSDAGLNKHNVVPDVLRGNIGIIRELLGFGNLLNNIKNSEPEEKHYGV